MGNLAEPVTPRADLATPAEVPQKSNWVSNELEAVLRPFESDNYFLLHFSGIGTLQDAEERLFRNRRVFSEYPSDLVTNLFWKVDKLVPYSRGVSYDYARQAWVATSDGEEALFAVKDHGYWQAREAAVASLAGEGRGAPVRRSQRKRARRVTEVESRTRRRQHKRETRESFAERARNVAHTIGVKFDPTCPRWIAHWKRGGQRYFKSFSVEKNGFNEAWRLAVMCRRSNFDDLKEQRAAKVPSAPVLKSDALAGQWEETSRRAEPEGLRREPGRVGKDRAVRHRYVEQASGRRVTRSSAQLGERAPPPPAPAPEPRPLGVAWSGEALAGPPEEMPALDAPLAAGMNLPPQLVNSLASLAPAALGAPGAEHLAASLSKPGTISSTDIDILRGTLICIIMDVREVCLWQWLLTPAAQLSHVQASQYNRYATVLNLAISYVLSENNPYNILPLLDVCRDLLTRPSQLPVKRQQLFVNQLFNVIANLIPT